MEMELNHMSSFYDLYVEEVAKNEKLTNDLKHAKIENISLTNRVKYLEDNMDAIVENSVQTAVSKVSAFYEAKIEKLNLKIAHLESLLNITSDNSGMPTSKTALDEKKRIPNSRVKSGKSVGGQIGHSKAKLEKFEDNEITDTINHKMRTCDTCGGKLIEQCICSSKDELEYQIIVKKIRHNFYSYVCENCGKKINVKVPTELKEDNQYGHNVQALAITLMNQGYVSMKRTSEIIYGLSMSEINLSVGYVSKLQKRLAERLGEFIKELKQEIIKKDIVHWDDTVIMIAEKQSCLRFYGDKNIALYTAHEKKNKEGIDEDGILLLLSKETIVVHDHNIVNYNNDYEFKNAECCVHLIRDLQKVIDNLQHEWPKNMIELITGSYKKRKTLLGLDASQVMIDYDKEVALGRIENLADKTKYYADKERALLNRLEKYKDNYLMWVINTEIPFSNNESERSLRSSKTKMKVSGQFQNIRSAEYFAIIKSYLETGKRYGMDIQFLITKALQGNYCSLEEMKNHVA